MKRIKAIVSDWPGRGRFYHFFTLVTLAYGLAVVLPLAVYVSIGERWNLIALYSTFAHFLWLPAFALLVIALIWRRWALAALMLAPVAAFTVVFGVRYLRPVLASGTVALPDSSGVGLSVMTYNILWRGGTYDDAIRVIVESDADIVALQELGTEAAEYIADGLRDRYPYNALHPQEIGVNGQGLFSRYPIRGSRFWQAPGILGAQSAIIEVEADRRIVEVAVHNVHTRHPAKGGFGFDPQLRIVGIDAILAHIAADTAEHRILLGDFNMPELSSDYARIRETWVDTFGLRGHGMGLTFRPRLSWFGGLAIPALRIDYIFVDGPIRVQSAQVVADTGGSDHRAVVSQIYLITDGTTGHQQSRPAARDVAHRVGADPNGFLVPLHNAAG